MISHCAHLTSTIINGPSKLARISLYRAAWPILDCARPIFSLEGGLDGLPLRVSNEGLLRPRVARAHPNSLHPSLGERPRLPFTARIERAHSYRARSASKKGTWPFFTISSKLARFSLQRAAWLIL